MDHRDSKSFWERIHAHCLAALLYHTRLHALPTFSNPSCQVYTLREDESSFGISGFKKRKLASLFHHLLNQPYQELVVIGGAFSNHVVGVLQLAREHKLPVQLVLKETPHKPATGNYFLLSLLAYPEELHWVNASDWPRRKQIAASYITTPPAFLLPEGGFCPEGIAGIATLWEEIKVHQNRLERTFDHIFMDAGTGLSVAVVQAMLARESPQTHLHIVSMADSPAQYLEKYHQVTHWIENLYSITIPPYHQFQVYRPYTARAFGSVNTTVRAYCQSLARTEGVLTDPVYSAKLFMNAQHIIARDKLQGNVLVIHSGGGTGLMGLGASFNF